MNKKKSIRKAQFREGSDEFMDNAHKVMDAYYALMEKNISPSKKRVILKELIKIDPDFYDSYIQLAYLLQEEEEYDKASEILYLAYQRAVTRIADKEGNFPKGLPWLWLENRHIIRAIDAWANELWEQGKTTEALEIFRKLLRSNPNDNIGARYSILAIRLGLEPDYETMFELKDMPGYMDAAKTIKWFKQKSKKFPEEFDWWFKEIKKQEE